MQSSCNRCEENFSSRNLLHKHIRKTTCTKASQLSKDEQANKKVDYHTSKEIKIITSIASTCDQDKGLEFRSWNFLQAFVKLISIMKVILICLNTECDAILADRAWILSILFDVSIKRMQIALKVKDIESTTHESIEFIHISIYFPDIAKNESAVFACITKEIHLINDLKAKMLVDNDFLGLEGFIIDIEDKSATIESCEINIALKIQLKGLYIRQTMHAQQALVLQSEKEQFISINDDIFEKKDFLFEPDSNVNFIMCSHILDISIKRILVKNEIEHAIKVFRRYRLDQISEIDCDNCFQIFETDLAIRSSKERTVISSIDFADMKVRLFNESMIYDNDETRTAFAGFIAEFLSLWKDRGFIDISKDKWMRISLKSDWQAKVNGKSKIYSLGIKNKAVLDKTFDELHMKSRIKWTDKVTPFSYPVFVTWKIVNDIRKKRAVIDIRNLNDLIVLDAYSISSQSNIINELRNCTHISVLDVSSFFYQWRMHSANTYKLTVVTHRDQETFLVSIMNCRNSVTYVQRRMNILLRQLQFAKAYIDDIVIRSKFLTEHINHLRQLFRLFVIKNIDLNFVKVFLDYPKVTLLRQKVNALDLSIIENRIKTLTSLKMSDTLAKLETYLDLIEYIRQYIHFYVFISRPLQDLKTVLLKSGSVSADVKKKAYISKTKLLLTFKKENFFNLLQDAISKAFILVHFDLERTLWIDLNESKERRFDIMVFHLKKELINDMISLRTHIEPIMFLSRLLSAAEMNYWPTELKMTALVWIVKKIRHLIESFKFSIVVQIDYSATMNICKQKLITSINSFIRSNIRLVRASQYFSQFSLDVRHKPDKDNIVSDALSRLNNTDMSLSGSNDYSKLNALNTFSYNTTLVKMNEDFRKKIIDEYVNDSNWRKHVLLLHKNDQLKKNASDMPFIRKKSLIYYIDQISSVRRLCVPKDCVKNILNIAHENDHSEYVKTHDIIIKSWYIHDLIKLLKKYIQHCSECLICQVKRHKSYESLQFIDSSSLSFHTITIDFVLTLPHSEIFDKVITSFDTMLTITDKFFKRILLIAEKSTYSAHDWANEMIKYLHIADWGYSMIIISDRDSKFLSNLWKSIFKTLQVDLLYTTAYHPQTDDSSERTNQTVKVALRHYLLIMKDSTKWSKIISRFQSILNNSSSTTTSKTPNEILYEFKSKQFLNLIAVAMSEINISKTRIDAADVIAWSKLNHKRNYDKNHTSMFLKEESYAYLRMHQDYFIPLSKSMIAKWSQRRIESFKIIKRIEKLAYKLKLLAHWKIHFVVSIQQLESASHDKDLYDRELYDNPSSMYVEEQSESEFYEIEKLMNKRTIRKGRDHFTQYLIRWKEYDSEHDTWYTIDDLRNAAELVVDYERNLNSVWINKKALMCISCEHWYYLSSIRESLLFLIRWKEYG